MTLRLRQAIAGRPTAKSRYNTCAGRLEDEPFIVCLNIASLSNMQAQLLTYTRHIRRARTWSSSTPTMICSKRCHSGPLCRIDPLRAQTMRCRA
jgi:hypothetical protein